MKLARRSPRGYGFDLGSGDRLRLYLRRPLQYIAIPTMALADDKLTPPQRRLEPLAPLHLAPQHRLEPQLHGALQHGAKLRNAILGAASRATPENAVSRATAVAATPAQHASFEKLQGPRSSATLRAEEKTPRAAVRKLTNCRPTSTSTPAMLIVVRVISGVMQPLARSRETLNRTAQ